MSSAGAFKYMREYDYIPDIPVAVIAAILFGMTTLLHLWQVYDGRAWFFIPFVCGGILEIMGYATRGISSAQYPHYTFTGLAMQSVFIMIAPSFLAAGLHMELLHLIAASREKHSSRRSWMTLFFVFGDVVSFLIQGAGSGMLVYRRTAPKGAEIIRIGLIIQIIFLSLFFVPSAFYHIRLTKSRSMRNTHWRKHQLVLYIGNIIILARCIFRLVEYEQGKQGALQQHEFWDYVFDACLMFLMMVIFNIVHPAGLVEDKKGFREDAIELME